VAVGRSDGGDLARIRWRSDEEAAAVWQGYRGGLVRMWRLSGDDAAGQNGEDHGVGRACEGCHARMSGNTELREQSAEGTER
jgi:hypothetical protein